MNPHDLIRIAGLLASGTAGGNRGRPRQAELRRAVSTAYYALFHALALCCANMVVGATRRNRSQPAWRQTYRALEHGHAKNQCNNQAVIGRFPPAIRRFAELFAEMQQQRHEADYDPESVFYRDETLYLIDQVEQTITDLDGVPARDKRAFAVYVLFRSRRN